MRSTNHVDCPKHGVPGVVIVRAYIEHWDPTTKSPKLCYVALKHLPEDVRKLLLSYGHRGADTSKTTVGEE